MMVLLSSSYEENSILVVIVNVRARNNNGVEEHRNNEGIHQDSNSSFATTDLVSRIAKKPKEVVIDLFKKVAQVDSNLIDMVSQLHRRHHQVPSFFLLYLPWTSLLYIPSPPYFSMPWVPLETPRKCFLKLHCKIEGEM
ncbi:hypothetical protein E2542_SST10394 [Spatholobus suberectus]|nr:hypothetical protein E2542_SST10394 [Spatholobus suberectus]